MVRIFCSVAFMWAGVPAMAELNSLFAQGTRPASEGRLVLATAARSGLFATSGDQGLFGPLPDQQNAAPTATSASVIVNPTASTGSSQIDRLLTLIARAEAGSAGYDAVQHGARIRPTKPPTQMTLGEIYDWIDATPRQPHAIGRYQFIPPTLRRVAAARGFGRETQFTPGVQDALALVLLEDAGLSQFQNGALDRRRFMRNLARIWAGLPLPNGRSYYEGHAGNKATMSWAAFDGGMARIWGGGG